MKQSPIQHQFMGLVDSWLKFMVHNAYPTEHLAFEPLLTRDILFFVKSLPQSHTKVYISKVLAWGISNGEPESLLYHCMTKVY